MDKSVSIAIMLTILLLSMNAPVDGISVENEESVAGEENVLSSCCSQSVDPAQSMPSTIRIWEAWAKGYATIYQADFARYTVYNNGPSNILIDEYILLMSPSPANPSEDVPGVDDETQDGVLTITYTIPSGSSLTYNYGHYVAQQIDPPPPWWCTEDSEFTNAGIEITLGGEIFPYEMISIIENYNTNTQSDVWSYLRNNPSVVIGKRPLWQEIANIGDEVDVTLEVTNIGFLNATNIVVTDTIPPDYSYDPSSFSHTPSDITDNPDGSTTLEWNFDQIDAAVETPDNEPTDYTTVYISYELLTPELAPDLRVFLPRAYVDKNDDGQNDAESERPLLETYFVNRPPVAVVDDVEILEGETAYLDGSDSYDPDEPYGDSIVSYEWDFNGDGIADDYGPVVGKIFGDNGNYTVTLTVWDSHGASSSTTANIVVFNVIPQIDPILNITMDEGDIEVFQAHAEDPGSDDLTFTWNWNDGTSDNVTIYFNNGVSPDPFPSPEINPMDTTDVVTHAYLDDGVYIVSVTVEDDDYGENQISFYVFVNDLGPTAEFTWHPEPQNEGSPVQFTDLSTSYPDDIVSWVWDFGGLGNSTEQNPEFTFMDDGTYVVTLTVTDDDGSQSSVSHNVTILDLAPSANFTWSPEPQDEGSPVMFIDTSISYPDDIISWAWDFGGLGNSTEQNPEFTFMDHGIYVVTLTVTDDDGSTDSISYNITILDLAPNANFTWSPEPQDEGSPVQFTDLSTSYPDVIVGWAWDFGDGGTSTLQNPNHTYGDNGVYTVTLLVTDDDGSTDFISYAVTILNVPPLVDAGENQTNYEGTTISFSGSFFDPGWLDTHTIEWNFGDGSSVTGTLTPTHTYGDNGEYTVTLTVTDDDGGVGYDTITVIVYNVAPDVCIWAEDFIFDTYSTDEGCTIKFDGNFTDPGWLDTHNATWDFGDGTVISGSFSPGQGFTAHSMDEVFHTYGDDGVFYVTLTVVDDDGGVGTQTITVTVNNVAPTVDLFGPYLIDENTPVTLNGQGTDPGSDDLTFTWEFEYGPTITRIYYNDGMAPDPYPSPDINPMDIMDYVSHIYGDNGNFTVTLTVEDDDGGIIQVTTEVIVLNVAPTVNIEAYMYANISLRVAGEKWHSVGIHLYEDGSEISSGIVTRYPGNPDEQTGTLACVMIDITKSYTALVDYLPNDPRVNGNVWGANPVWIIMSFEDGSTERLHHTFNVRKSYWNSDHWNHIDPWEVDITPYLGLHNITFEAQATDPGSDDLTFFWDFGDSTFSGPNTYMNNGLSPDPYPSPEINPMTATDSTTHRYTTSGTYTIILTVTDDDGESTTISITLDIVVD